MLKILTSVVLLAAAAPFPAPKVTPVTDEMKFTSGTVLSLDAAKNELKVTATAGVVTFKLSPSALLIGSNGQATTAASLHAGQAVYVYFVVQNGAIVSELDVQGT